MQVAASHGSHVRGEIARQGRIAGGWCDQKLVERKPEPSCRRTTRVFFRPTSGDASLLRNLASNMAAVRSCMPLAEQIRASLCRRSMHRILLAFWEDLRLGRPLLRFLLTNKIRRSVFEFCCLEDARASSSCPSSAAVVRVDLHVQRGVPQPRPSDTTRDSLRRTGPIN